VHPLSVLLDVESTHTQDPVHAALVPQALATLRAQLREVNAALAMSASLGVSPMLWAPYRDYLTMKLSQASDSINGIKQQDAARKFFEVAFPRYTPQSTSEFIRLRRDRRLVALRNEISRAHATGDVMDPAYPQRAIEEVVRIERKAGKFRTIIGVLSTLVGTIPLPFLGVAAAAISEAAARAAEVKLRKKLQWLYVMSDGTGHT
jgi:hypothetical protein